MSDESWTFSRYTGNGLVPSGNKLLPEPMLTQIHLAIAIWHHWASTSQANLPVRITLCMCSLVQGVITLSQLWHPTKTVDNLPLSLTALEEAAPKSPFFRGCLYHMYDKQTSIPTKMPSDKTLENWQLYNACKTGWSEANWTILKATATHKPKCHCFIYYYIYETTHIKTWLKLLCICPVRL